MTWEIQGKVGGPATGTSKMGLHFQPEQITKLRTIYQDSLKPTLISIHHALLGGKSPLRTIYQDSLIRTLISTHHA
jgi:hypothetical protein